MEYTLNTFTIQQLYELVEKDQIDLNPSYQRNFIWSVDNQNELIDTILRAYPLPNFFFYKKPTGGYEMVDGQQRTKTIYRFIKGVITASKNFEKVAFNQIDQKVFLKYTIPVVIIDRLIGTDSLKEFYVLINKKGVHLNIAEVNKSEYFDTNYLRLANDLLSYQNLINLNLFTEATIKRMNDRSFIEELLAYLYSGIKEKKKSVESLYKSDIDQAEYDMLDIGFKRTIDKIATLNKLIPISSTRYKQKNDFYTFFAFVNENLDETNDLLAYQYRILILLDGEDQDGRQFIRPSNEECEALREYANNCVTQSNSKSAREKRLTFFNDVLKNTAIEKNETLADILKYLANVYDGKIDLKKVDQYELINLDIL
jgi:hypothetical protein